MQNIWNKNLLRQLGSKPLINRKAAVFCLAVLASGCARPIVPENSTSSAEQQEHTNDNEIGDLWAPPFPIYITESIRAYHQNSMLFSWKRNQIIDQDAVVAVDNLLQDNDANSNWQSNILERVGEEKCHEKYHSEPPPGFDFVGMYRTCAQIMGQDKYHIFMTIKEFYGDVGWIISFGIEYHRFGCEMAILSLSSTSKDSQVEKFEQVDSSCFYGEDEPQGSPKNVSRKSTN